MTEPALVESEYEDGRIHIRLSGEIDLSNAGSVETQIEHVIADVRDVAIDLSSIEFIDSGGLRLLKRISKSIAARNATLAVTAPPGSIARSVLDMTSMSDELRVRDSL